MGNFTPLEQCHSTIIPAGFKDVNSSHKGSLQKSSLAPITVFSFSDPPVAIIVREGTAQTSVNQVLQVVAGELDYVPTFTCSADGWPTPILSWGRGEALPNGVSLIPSGRNLTLAWHRALEYTDSGNYTCNATNSVGISSVRLELLVRRELSSFLLNLLITLQ